KRFEIEACKPWLEEELRVVGPEAIVLLGATAGKALLGPSFRVTKVRGQPIESELSPLVTATIHPSAILRAPDDEARHAAGRAAAAAAGACVPPGARGGARGRRASAGRSPRRPARAASRGPPPGACPAARLAGASPGASRRRASGPATSSVSTCGRWRPNG